MFIILIALHYICTFKQIAMAPNKELQEQRMRGYFKDATREILKGEGLKALSVRTVAERAGYSFATMYNYFRDLNELIFLCVNDFMEECETLVNEVGTEMEPGRERLNVRVKAYISYFTQYPGIFELFFVEKMNDIGSKHPTARTIYEFSDKLFGEDVEALTGALPYAEKINRDILDNLRHSVTGMLLFYNNRLQPRDYREFIAIALRQTELCLAPAYA